mgnify:FL=1
MLKYTDYAVRVITRSIKPASDSTRWKINNNYAWKFCRTGLNGLGVRWYAKRVWAKPIFD